MTRRRDRYQSAFDWGNQPGVSAASYDLMLALMLLDRYAKEHRLYAETVSIGVKDKHTYTLGKLLDIAEAARRQSIGPALNVYQRLQQNEEAARLLAETMADDPRWTPMSFALSSTLDDKAIMSRGWISAARRELACREKQNGGGAR